MLTKIAQLFLLGVLPYVLIGVAVPDVSPRDEADSAQESIAEAPGAQEEQDSDLS